MKKFLSVIIAAVTVLLTFVSCGRPTDSGKLKIVCTTFVQYDFAKNILGSDDSLILLIDNGADLHGFEPTAEDIVNIGTASLFVYGGGVSDRWVSATLEAASNTGLRTFAMMDYVEPLCIEEEHEHSHSENEHHHHEENEVDEHIWLSVKNAVAIVENFCDAICETDPENEAKYRSNTEEYINKLQALDAEYEAAVSNAEREFLLFADRFPFIYLTNDYSLRYHAAFTGCSSETEASTETMKSLIDHVNEFSLPYVIQIDGSDGRIANQVCEETGAQVLTLNSCQSVAMKDIENGANYIDIMTQNLEVLKEALN